MSVLTDGGTLIVLRLYHPKTPSSPLIARIRILAPLLLTCPFTMRVGEVHGRPGRVMVLRTYSDPFLSRTDTSACTPATGPGLLLQTYAYTYRVSS
eukprot:6207597-Pleurochrysis_carterae.AAC.1